MTKVIEKPANSESRSGVDLATRREVFRARCATGIAIFLVFLLIALGCHSQRDQIFGRENERAENLARAFEFHVRSEVQNIDDLLRQLRKMPLASPAGFAAAVEELRTSELGQRSIMFAVTGTDGTVRHSTEVEGDGDADGKRAFFGDREYFKAHIAQTDDRLFISRPMLEPLTDGLRSLNIHFSRRFVDPAGQLQGVVVLAMPQSVLTLGTQTLGLRPDDVASILRQDGYLLSRTTAMLDLAKQMTHLPAEFLLNFDGEATGLFEATSPIDQVRRLIAFRRVDDFSLLAIVAPSTRHRDLELQQTTWRHWALALVVAALLLAFHRHHERALRLTGKLRRDNERERQHLAEAQNIARLGSWQLNLADHQLEWSAEVYRIFGLDDERAGAGLAGKGLTHDDFLACVHSDDRVAVNAAFGRTRETGKPYELRHRIVRPDGSVRHVIQHGQVEFDRRGLMRRFTGTIQDVTEALDAEIRLLDAARSDRLARAVFDGVMQPMLVLSADGRLVDVNPAFEERFSVSAEHLRGRSLRELEASKDGAVPFACRPSRLFRYDQPVTDWEGDIVVKKDGREQVLSLSLSGIRDAARRVEHYVGIYTDVTQRKQREDDAVHQASHDALTGLPNRQYAMDRLTRSLHRAHRRHQQGVLIFIDLDHFKEINDTHGHDAGDEVLRVVASRFQAAIRQEDMVARLGGDEFVALIEEVNDMDVARRVAEAIRVAAAEPVTYSGTLNHLTLRVSASLGIAVFPRPDEDSESLLARADAAMYEAKRDGRDAVRYSADNHEESEAPLAT